MTCKFAIFTGSLRIPRGHKVHEIKVIEYSGVLSRERIHDLVKYRLAVHCLHAILSSVAASPPAPSPRPTSLCPGGKNARKSDRFPNCYQVVRARAEVVVRQLTVLRGGVRSGVAYGPPVAIGPRRRREAGRRERRRVKRRGIKEAGGRKQWRVTTERALTARETMKLIKMT